MSFRRELAIGLGSYAAYLVVRHAVWTDDGRARATTNAQRIVDMERRCGVHVEPEAQRMALRAPALMKTLNAGYALGNLALSVGWLIALYRSNDPRFRRERRAAAIALNGALPFFLAMPTAPPRTRDDFTDTLRESGVDLQHPGLVRLYNPIAAMPSHHVAFAVVTGWGLARDARTRAGRVGWRLYPAAVTAVVVATANHYVADVVAGAALGASARWLTR